MSWLWALPPVILTVGVLIVVAAIMGAADEMHRLAADLRRWRALQPVAAQVSRDAQALMARFEEQRHR